MKKLLTLLLALLLGCAALTPAMAAFEPEGWIASFEELWATLESDEGFAFEITPEGAGEPARLSATIGDVLYFTLKEVEGGNTVITFVLETQNVPDDVEQQAKYDVSYAVAIANALHIAHPDMSSEQRAATLLLLLDYMDGLRYGESTHEETAFQYEGSTVSMERTDDGQLMTDLIYES